MFTKWLKINMRNTMIKVKQYVKENWGSPFIVGFMFLLIGAAVFTVYRFALLS